jgi:flagellar motor switch protein FliM
MIAKLKVPITSGKQHPVFDPRSLGRPVHLLKDFAAELHGLLEDLFRQTLNRRYRANYALGEIIIEPATTSKSTGPWLTAEHTPGHISCLLERTLVLSVMQYRYGAAASQLGAAGVPPETTTEERLAGLLGQQLLLGLAVRLMNPASTGTPAIDIAPALHRAPANDAWSIRVPVHDPQGLQSSLLFAIDAAWMNQLLREREPRRKHKAAAALPQPRELTARLQMKLVARLLQTDMPLGDLLDLQPGAVIPVSLRATEVLVDGERLFTASVAEHQGKLCLTSFADAE